MLLREPQLQLHLVLKAAHELRAAQRQIIVLGQQDAYRRLASFLVEFSRHQIVLAMISARLRSVGVAKRAW